MLEKVGVEACSKIYERKMALRESDIALHQVKLEQELLLLESKFAHEQMLAETNLEQERMRLEQEIKLTGLL